MVTSCNQATPSVQSISLGISLDWLLMILLIGVKRAGRLRISKCIRKSRFADVAVR